MKRNVKRLIFGITILTLTSAVILRSRQESLPYEFLREAEHHYRGTSPYGHNALIYIRRGNYDEVYDEVKRELIVQGFLEAPGLGFFRDGYEYVLVSRADDYPYIPRTVLKRTELQDYVVIYATPKENLRSKITRWATDRWR